MSTQQDTSTDDRLYWFKSTYSGSGGGDCVEVAIALNAVHVRDSKHAGGPALNIQGDSWPAFLTYVTGSSTDR